MCVLVSKSLSIHELNHRVDGPIDYQTGGLLQVGLFQALGFPLYGFVALCISYDQHLLRVSIISVL